MTKAQLVVRTAAGFEGGHPAQLSLQRAVETSWSWPEKRRGQTGGKKGEGKAGLGTRTGGSRRHFLKADPLALLKPSLARFICSGGALCTHLNSSPAVFSFHKPRLCVVWDWDSLSFLCKAHSWCGYSPCCSLPGTAGLQIVSSRKKNGELSTQCQAHWQTCFLPFE